MNGYTKLFGSIVASTIWRESKETKIVWITMLALSNKYGVVEASLPGLADLARVSIEDTKTAIEVLMSPDSFSRTKDFDGRRIEEVDGGWAILNHGKYRAKMSIDERREYNRVKQAEWRARQSPSNPCQQKSITVNDSQSRSITISEVSTCREQRAEAQATHTPIPSLEEQIYDAYPRKTGKQYALKAIRKALSAFPLWRERMLSTVQQYSIAVSKWPEDERQYVPHPATWFNRGCYEDDPNVWIKVPKGQNRQVQTGPTYHEGVVTEDDSIT